MYVITFRIPYTVMGRRQYLNGSCLSPSSYNQGFIIQVVDKFASEKIVANAEVIESRLTNRVNFSWEILKN